jgi:hypothetical protein
MLVILGRPSQHRLGAVRATACVEGNLAKTFGTFLGGGIGGFVAFVHAGNEPVDRNDHEEIHGGSDQ